MKQFIHTFLLALTIWSIDQNCLYAQWSKVKGPFGGDVTFLEFYAGSYWAGAESGLYQSADGQDWHRVENLGSEPVVAGLADQDTLYIIRGSKRSDLFRTTNGGQSWKVTPISSQQPGPYVSLGKASGFLIIARVTLDFLYLRSKNNGATFTSLPDGGPNNYDKFDANQNIIVKNGGGGTISISLNGGNSSFTRPIAPGFTSLYQVLALDSAIVTRVEGSGGAVVAKISFDTAQNWQTMFLPAGFDPMGTGLLRSDKKGLIAWTNEGQYAWSTDYGEHWQVFTSPEIPSKLLEINNNWLISSSNGFYFTSDQGANWTDASHGFSGHVIYRVQAAGNRLYALTADAGGFATSIFYLETGTNAWKKTTTPNNLYSRYMNATGSDTVLMYDVLSVDGGISWNNIEYPPGLSGFAARGIEIYDHKAYILLSNPHIFVLPLSIPAVSQKIYGPTNDNPTGISFAGDSLYVVDSQGRIFLQLPNTTNWISLTTNPPGPSGKLFRINGRLFQPRRTGIRYTDDGFTFQNLSVTGLNSTPTDLTVVNDMVGVDSIIIAATEMGTFFSNDRGEAWWPFQSGFQEDSLPVVDLTIQNGVLYAAMYRHGIWQRSVSGGSTINGIVYTDENQNGVQDAGEPSLVNVKVAGMLSGSVALTDSLGRYNLLFDLPLDTIRTIPPVIYSSVQPAYHLTGGFSSSQDFGISFQANVTDLSISATHETVMRPGFESSLYLHVANAGTSTVDASVGLKLPSGVQYLNASPVPDMVLGDSMVWSVESIPLLGHRDIAVEIQVDSSVPIGVLLNFNASVLPENSDNNNTDNTSSLEVIVVGSYDPNDKQVWPGSDITPDQIMAGLPLRYTIRFQNTGTYPAERVRLVDTLDVNLDLTTLSVIGASHPFTWEVKGHILEILFDQIHLLDSNSNEPASHGFFSFSVAAKRTLPIESALFNQASIYFDYNSPIHTNTVSTQVSFESDVSVPAHAPLYLYVFPNPISEKFTVQVPAPGGHLSLYNAIGKRLKSWSSIPEQMEVSLQGVTDGLYYIQWQKGNAAVLTKIVINK